MAVKFLARLCVGSGLFLALVSSPYVRADEHDGIADRIGNGDPVAGEVKSKAELCQGCHGDQGNSSGGEYPRLAGQYADYIMKQFRDFRSGARQHHLMNAVAESIKDEDLADIAAYFASRERVRSQQKKSNEIAEKLFVNGDMKRTIMACASCHGTVGQGSYVGSESFPAIAGQHKLYLREQLLKWRSLERKNSPGGVMNLVAKSLRDEEIEALADYISGM
ncbi:cytochrome c4 [Methylobacillus gramineus]|uniref:c-type cytochrome n=1 Tax=Methylobacillus gramineus TaxID=755169 RepID=UPI001CFFE7E8|nr:c-type cytochrome [Methylobacillus gramineus]MCB5183608.1 cytochrome c4 [Methylobacillus gramineus]